MSSFNIHFSAEGFQFKVCLLTCSFSVSDLSFIKSFAWSKINVTLYHLVRDPQMNPNLSLK